MEIETLKIYKLIIVDDEWLIRERLKLEIQEMGLPIEIVGEAENGQEAMPLFGPEHPDVVITDVRMPVMNGLELAEWAKTKGYNSKFIILSGYAEFEYAREALSAGVSDYLLKPVDKTDLKKVLETVFGEIAKERAMDLSWQKKIIKAAELKEAEHASMEQIIEEITEYIEMNFNENINLYEIAEQKHVTPNYLSKRFKDITGKTFHDYLINVRLERAKELLKNTEIRVSHIASSVGYNDYGYFCKAFKNKYDVTPIEYRKSTTGN